ncbi:MAG: 3'(2'),5'-bisphosphate nucleotidase CysQ [Myxococcaceae bacterium]
MQQDLQHELDIAVDLAREAGRIVLEVYATGFAVEDKPDGAGPVTEADQRANDFIVDRLRSAFPGDGVVAEESPVASHAARSGRCWFVDPVDGTAEFVEKNGMFAVHIGLAIDGQATVGVVFGPVPDKLYAGIVGRGAFLEEHGRRRPLQVSPPPASRDMRLVVSRSHKSKQTDRVRAELGITRVSELGSVGLKCGLIAEGGADLYLHPSDRSYRWDSCAPEAMLRAAGGVLTDFGGQPYRYDTDELRNVRGMIGCASAALPLVLPAASRIARESGLLPDRG